VQTSLSYVSVDEKAKEPGGRVSGERRKGRGGVRWAADGVAEVIKTSWVASWGKE